MQTCRSILRENIRPFFAIDVLRKLCNHPGSEDNKKKREKQVYFFPTNTHTHTHTHTHTRVDLATALGPPPDYSDPSVGLPWTRSGKMVVLEQLLRIWKGEWRENVVYMF